MGKKEIPLDGDKDLEDVYECGAPFLGRRVHSRPPQNMRHFRSIGKQSTRLLFHSGGWMILLSRSPNPIQKAAHIFCVNELWRPPPRVLLLLLAITDRRRGCGRRF